MNNLIKLPVAYEVCFCNNNNAEDGVSAVKIIAWAVLLDILMHTMIGAFIFMVIGLAIIGVMGGPKLWKTQAPKDVQGEVVS